ncbi:hypothetical protein FQN54_003611 [Arachnomyces sp. PD_36]|nr:hypothetical protein FQN54_003611 [Arachnomyces sp. PD_36]
MSFGFSVGDIILVSQIAYKLYTSVSKGRHAASKDLKELEDVLFSLRCALDHLGKVAEEILPQAAQNPHDAGALEMREKLNFMINSCADTLGELEKVTQMYREGVLLSPGNGKSVAERGIRERTVDRFKVNWLKIRWDRERSSLSEYREKLQSHTDAINMILSVFLCAKIDGEANAKKMEELQNQALRSNQSLLKVVEEVRNILLTKEQSLTPPPPPEVPSGGEIRPPGSGLQIAAFTRLTPDPVGSTRYHHGPSIDRGLLDSDSSRISAPLDERLTVERPHSLRNNFGRSGASSMTLPIETKPTRKTNLPSEIVQLNHKRQATGWLEFSAYQKRAKSPKPLKKQQPSKASFLTWESPGIRQFQDGLTYIFRPFPETTSRQAAIKWEERKHEIKDWFQGFDRLLDSCIANPAKGKDLDGEELVGLLVHLNECTEMSDGMIKDQFYQIAEQMGIDNMLKAKLQKTSKSVRAMKEVEEFMDVREDWYNGQNRMNIDG